MQPSNKELVNKELLRELTTIMMFAVQRQAVGMICRRSNSLLPRITSLTSCNSSFIGGLIEQRRQIYSNIPTIRTAAVHTSGSRIKIESQITQHRTMMARSSSDVDPSTNPEAKAISFLVGTLGYEQNIAQGVVDALKQSGVSGGSALLSMVRTLAGRWEVDEDAGLEALVESVTLEVARTENKKLIKIWIVPSSGWASKESDVDDDGSDSNDDTPTDLTRAFQVEGYEDMSLTDVAKFGDGDGAQVLGEMIECACSGIMACSTCHVVVANEWFDRVGPPSEAESDMIDLAYNAQRTSRLGCQVILKPELDNAIFLMPLGANNMMDFIPFEDD